MVEAEIEKKENCKTVFKLRNIFKMVDKNFKCQNHSIRIAEYYKIKKNSGMVWYYIHQLSPSKQLKM